MPMTSHSHGSHSHAHAPGLEQHKKGMVAAAAAAGLTGATNALEKHQKMTPVTPTAAAAPPNPLHAAGERCKARVPAKVPLTEINQFLICQLCFGYLVDATAIIECQHAFCKSCILKYLENKNNYCPICEVQLNEAKPHSSLRSDEILQKLVYKLVPGLFVAEVRRRGDFLNKSCASADNNGLNSASGTGNGDGKPTTATPKNGTGTVSVEDVITSMEMKDGDEDLVFLSPDDSVSLSLEYFKSTSSGNAAGQKQPDEDENAKSVATANNARRPSAEKQMQKQPGKGSAAAAAAANNAENKRKNETASAAAQSTNSNSNSNSNTITNSNANANANAKNTCSDNKANDRRYLQCPAAVSVGLLKKFIRMKYGLSDDYRVDLLYNGDRDSNLENDLTLLDLALIFKWKKAEPMCFHYRIFDRPFKPTNTRPGSKRPFSSLMDHEPPNDGDASSTGPPNKSPAPAKLTRFTSSSSSDGKTTESGTGKTQPKNKSLTLTMSSESSSGGKIDEQDETKIKPIDRPQEDSMKFRALNAGGKAGLINLEDAIEESKVKAKLSIDTKLSTSPEQHKLSGPCGQKLSVVMPKVPPLIVTSPTRDPGSPLKISFGHVSTSPSSKSSSASPEGKTHHHHHHHHHKHHRHHKEKHRKHSKSKSKDRDKEKGSSGSSSSDKSKHKEKRKEEKAKAAQAQASASAAAASAHTDTKDKEARYKYNAHPNPSQSQTISVKSGKYPVSLLTPAPAAGVNAIASTANMANAKPNAAGSIGKLEHIINKKIKNVGTGTGVGPNFSGQNATASAGGVGAMKKSAGIFPERRMSTSSTASSSSQASLTVSLKPKQASNAPGSKEASQQQQQRQPLNNAKLPDSVHLQVPKSVTLIPVNPNSGQVLGNKQQQQTQSQQRAGNPQQQQHQGRPNSATTFTHPLTNKSLHQITVTEVPPPTSKSASSTGSSGHKQFNGPGSMEITKIYCDKSASASSSTKVFDPQGKKLKGLDISISNANSARAAGEQNKNSITVSKATGLPKIPGVSILPQSMAKSGKLPKNSISMHAMSISAATATGGSASRIKEKLQQGSNSNRLSITTIQQQQQQQQQSLLKIPHSSDNRKSGEIGRNAAANANTLRRSLSPHSGSGTPPRKLQQQRITPSPPNKLSQLLHASSHAQDQIITAKMINRRSSIEITPVGSMNQKANKIKRPFESTFNKHAQPGASAGGSKQPPGSASPPGKREKLASGSGSNNNSEQQKPRTKRESECPLDLSGKSSRSTPPGSLSDYDSSNSSFSTDRPSTPNISITASSPPSHRPHQSKSSGNTSGKSHNVAHGTQTISSIAQTLTQKQQHAKEQKSSVGNRSQVTHVAGGLTLSPPIISPSSHHSPNSASSPVGTGPGFHPLGNLLTLSNAAAHLRKMNHHNHPLNNLAAAAAAGAGGFCPSLLRPPGPGSMLQQQHSPSSQCLNSMASPPISPNAITSSGLLSHFNHHQMSMSNLMNSPLMQMNSAAAAAAASLLDPTSPASLFCARMGFPQPNPSSPLNPAGNNPAGINPFFPSSGAVLTRPPHSSPSSALRIPNVSNSKGSSGHTTKSPSMSHSSSSMQSSKSHNHSPKSSSSPSSGSASGKSHKVNGNMTNTSTFVAPFAKSQAQSVKNAIPNSMKISNFLPTNKSSSANTNATITSSCGDYESLLMAELPLASQMAGVGAGTKLEIGSRHSPPVAISGTGIGIKPESQDAKHVSSSSASSCETSKDSKPLPRIAEEVKAGSTMTSTSASSLLAKSEVAGNQQQHQQSSLAKKVPIQKLSTNAKYVCSPGGIKLVSAKVTEAPSAASSSAENGQHVVVVANATATTEGDYEKKELSCAQDDDESKKLLSTQDTQQQQEAVITKLHENEKDESPGRARGGLGALGIALGLVPRERDGKDQHQHQIPLLSLTGTSSIASASAPPPTTTTTMNRTTQQQNLAVRHIPNPSLIFSRNNVVAAAAAPTPSTPADANKNVTLNNQILTTKTETETQMKAKDEDQNEEKDADTDKVKCLGVKTEDRLVAQEQEQQNGEQVVHVKHEIAETESCSKAVVADLIDVVANSPLLAKSEKETCTPEMATNASANIDDRQNQRATIKKEDEDAEISENTDGIDAGENLTEDSSVNSNALKDEINFDAQMVKNEEECSESQIPTAAEADVSDEKENPSQAEELEDEDKVDASSISFGLQIDAEPIVNRSQDFCTPLNKSNAAGDKAEIESDQDSGQETVDEVNHDDAMEIEEPDSAFDADENSTPVNSVPDHENALVMVNDDDTDEEEVEAEAEDANFVLREDSSSASASAEAYADGYDEVNSVGNRTTEDSTSCDDEDMEMEIDSNEPERQEAEEAGEVQNSPTPPQQSENEESTNAMVLLSVEDLVTQVENDNNNTISVFPSLTHNQGDLQEEVPMEIDELDARVPIPVPDLTISIPDIVVTEPPQSKSASESNTATSIQNGSAASPVSERDSTSTPLPAVLAPLSVVTTSPESSSAQTQSPRKNSPSGSSRPNSLLIANSPSPINKLAYLKSGSCSPVSPSSVKSGEHNLRKMENLEKVAAGLLVTATNINNNTISAPAPPTATANASTDAGGAASLVLPASANCDLTISATAAPVSASDSKANANANSSLQPPVSNV